MTTAADVSRGSGAGEAARKAFLRPIRRSAWVAPLLTLGVMALAAWYQASFSRPTSWAAYHAAAAAAVAEGLPVRVRTASGSWIGVPAQPPPPAFASPSPVAAAAVAFVNFAVDVPGGQPSAEPESGTLAAYVTRDEVTTRAVWPTTAAAGRGLRVVDSRLVIVHPRDEAGPVSAAGGPLRAVAFEAEDADGSRRAMLAMLIVPGHAGEPGRTLVSIGDALDGDDRYRQRRRGGSVLIAECPLPTSAGATPEVLVRLLEACGPLIRRLLNDADRPTSEAPEGTPADPPAGAAVAAGVRYDNAGGVDRGSGGSAGVPIPLEAATPAPGGRDWSNPFHGAAPAGADALAGGTRDPIA